VMNDNKYLAAELIDDYPQLFSKFTTLLEMRNVPATFRVSPKLLEMQRRASYRGGYREAEEDEDDEEPMRREDPADEAGEDEDDDGMRFRDDLYATPTKAAAAPSHAAAAAAGATGGPATHSDGAGASGHAPYVSQGFYAPPPPPPALPVDLPPPPYIPPLMQTSSMPIAEAKAINAAADDAEVATNIEDTPKFR